jgi:phosphohistidine phosphatase
MRHAAAQPHVSSDAERPLTPKGQTTATQAGEFLRAIDVVPDHVLVSPAQRCPETGEHVRLGLGAVEGTVRVVDHRIYSASPDSLLEVLRSAPAEARTVMLIAHNPAVAYVASVLADADGPIEVMQEMLHGLLPGALAVYETDLAWADLDMMGARATHFHDGSTG